MEPRSWYRSPLTWAAAVVAAIVVVGLVVVLAVNAARPTTDPTASPSTPTASTTPSPAGDASICGLEAGASREELQEAPAAEWAPVGLALAPTTAAGPGIVEADGFRHCYSRTTEGALLAASNYLVISGHPELAPRIGELLVDAASDATSSGAPTVRAELVGYRILEFDETTAVVDLAIRVQSQEGALVSLPLPLRWENGDWKIDPPAASFTPAVIESLGGYTAWSAS